MREKFIVVASFILIFSFASVDNAVSPMVDLIHMFFNIPIERVLWLISYCTFGIVVGVFVGPAIINAFRIKKVLLVGILGLATSLALFLFTGSFYIALFYRVLFGLSAGLIASCMWWITYYGVSQKYYSAMVVVLMSARPLSVALGVPFAGYLASVYGDWKTPFWFYLISIFIFGSILFYTLKGKSQTSKFTLVKIIKEYIQIFKIRNAAPFYLGMTINKMCYFGFYAMSGLWFIRHYGLDMLRISKIMFFIGVAETAINFVIPKIAKCVGYQKLFDVSLILSGILFIIFIPGKIPLVATVALISVFMLLDRLYTMSIVIKIPEIFPSVENKTTFGSLNTLSMWMGLTIISWFEGEFLQKVGIQFIQMSLFALFIIGSCLLYLVFHRALKAQEK